MISVQFTVFSVQHKFVSRRYGISYCESNYLSGFWQMKNDTLAGFFDFWGCLYVIMNGELWIMNLVVVKMGSIFKKQCINFPSGLAVAQSKGIIFLFAYWDVPDCFY